MTTLGEEHHDGDPEVQEISDCEFSPQRFKKEQFTFVNPDQQSDQNAPKAYSGVTSQRQGTQRGPRHAKYKSIEKSERLSKLTIEVEDDGDEDQNVFEHPNEFDPDAAPLHQPLLEYTAQNANMRYAYFDEEPVIHSGRHTASKPGP
jgi:hypothetical protein